MANIRARILYYNIIIRTSLSPLYSDKRLRTRCAIVPPGLVPFAAANSLCDCLPCSYYDVHLRARGEITANSLWDRLLDVRLVLLRSLLDRLPFSYLDVRLVRLRARGELAANSLCDCLPFSYLDVRLVCLRARCELAVQSPCPCPQT